MTEGDAATIPFYKSVGCDQCNHTGFRGRVRAALRTWLAAKLPTQLA